MLLVRSILVALTLAAIGCSSQKPTPAQAAATPSLADQLAAAKELAQIAEEDYLKAVKDVRNAEGLLAIARERHSEENIDKLEKVVLKLENTRQEARQEWDAAKQEVERLAKELLRR